MTGSANCGICSKGRGDFCGVKCIGVISNSEVFVSFVLGKDSSVGMIRTAQSMKRSSRSNILLSFDIRYSLFDILRFKISSSKNGTQAQQGSAYAPRVRHAGSCLRNVSIEPGGSVGLGV